jgi:hypothetical protein
MRRRSDEDPGDRGIVAGGNAQFYGGQAVSTGSGSATSYGGWPGADPRTEEFRLQLEELVRLIAEHQHDLNDPDAMRAQAELVRAEAAKARPDPSLLRGSLAGLAAMAGQVSAVAGAVTAVRTLLGV